MTSGNSVSVKPTLARGEMLEAKIDRIHAGLYGGLELRPVAGRAHDLGLMIRILHNNHLHPNAAVESPCCCARYCTTLMRCVVGSFTAAGPFHVLTSRPMSANARATEAA